MVKSALSLQAICRSQFAPHLTRDITDGCRRAAAAAPGRPSWPLEESLAQHLVSPFLPVLQQGLGWPCYVCNAAVTYKIDSFGLDL